MGMIGFTVGFIGFLLHNLIDAIEEPILDKALGYVQHILSKHLLHLKYVTCNTFYVLTVLHYILYVLHVLHVESFTTMFFYITYSTCNMFYILQVLQHVKRFTCYMFYK